MKSAPPLLTTVAEQFASLIVSLEIAQANRVSVRHETDQDYPDSPPDVRVYIDTFAPQMLRVTVGWLHDEAVPHYFVNWSSITGDFCCNMGTPFPQRALFDLGGCVELASKFQRQEAQRKEGGRD